MPSRMTELRELFGTQCSKGSGKIEDWKEMLEKNGFKVELNIEGLGQIPEIQSYYLNR